MYTRFVHTSNVDRFLTAAAAIDQRVAPEACIVLAQGQAGFGKSAAGRYWAVQKDALSIRLKCPATPHWFLTDLVRSLGEDAPAHTCERLFNQACGYLVKSPRPLVVDECEHGLGAKLEVLETVRGISDIVDVPVVLIGREYTWGALKRHKQFSTRIGAFAEFAPATLDDVRKCVEELCEVRLADAVIRRIHEESEGHVRNIVKAIKNAERIGKKNPKQAVTLEAVGATPLTHDWQRSKKQAA